MAAVPLTAPPERISPTQLLLRFSNGVEGDTYYIWKNGEPEATTTDTSYTFFISPFENIQIDIFDDPADEPVYFPDRATIQLNVSEGTAGINMQELVDAEWTTRQTLVLSDESVILWQSRVLEEGESFTFRAVPFDAARNEGEAFVLGPFPMIRAADEVSGEVEYLPAGANLRITINE